MMVKFKWSIIHGKYEIGCLCACRHKYFKYNKLNTSCNPQYYHDDVSASDGFSLQEMTLSGLYGMLYDGLENAAE